MKSLRGYHPEGLFVPHFPFGNRRRLVRLCRTALAWWPLVPGFDKFDVALNFPFNAQGEQISFATMQRQLDDCLRKAGWQGRIPKAAGRRCFLAACAASSVPFPNVPFEVGHLWQHDTHHLCLAWSSGEADAYLNLVPPCER